MKRSRPTPSLILSLAVASACCAYLPTRVRAGDPAQAPVGLDALNDDKLLTELAGRGMDSLLDRAFDVDNVPPAKRESIRALVSLQRLRDADKLSAADRDRAINDVTAGLDKSLPSLKDDPKVLIDDALLLEKVAIEPEVNTLEYWGPNDATEAKVRPIVETVVKLYAQAADGASAKANDIANRLKSPDDPLAAQWQQMSNLAGQATGNKYMLYYDWALSMDPADPKRKATADEAINGLADYDNADSNVQPVVRLQIGKLYIAKGDKDSLAKAKQTLGTLVRPDAQNPVKPGPTPVQQFNARYFSAVADLLAGDTKTAEGELTDASSYLQQQLPDDKGSAAALLLLKYRILAAQAEAETDPAAKEQANAAAVGQLLELVKTFPGLRRVIFDQLVTKVPNAPDYSKLDPLVLQALIQQGEDEARKAAATPGAPRNKALLERSFAAAREYVKRPPGAGIDPQMAAHAQLLAPFFLEQLGRPTEAADGFLDFATKNKTADPATANKALDEAEALIAQVRTQTPVDPQGHADDGVVRLEDKFYPLALGQPFNRRQFALLYAQRLARSRHYVQAVPYYQMVADGEEPPRVLSARYGEMDALKNELDDNDKLTGGDRAKMVNRVQALADAVTATAQAQLKDPAATETDRTRCKLTLARTALLAADVARREQKDPNRVLALLTNFEDAVHGLPAEKDLLSGALFLRVQSYMALQRNNEATAALVQYLNTTGGTEGAQTVRDLLVRLNDDLDHARAAGDAARIRQLADNRAMLSGFLVKWAEENKDERIHKFTYTYRRFDADTKRLAATLEQDPDKRKAELDDARKLYENLFSPENVALYKGTIDPASKANPDYPDPAVTLGLGLIAFEQGDCKTVQEKIGQLLYDGKLGEDTDQYWEATYKLLKCNTTLAKANDPDTHLSDVQRYLKGIYLYWRDGTGGRKWHDPFEQLRQEIIPEFQVPADTVSSPTTTAPAAG